MTSGSRSAATRSSGSTSASSKASSGGGIFRSSSGSGVSSGGVNGSLEMCGFAPVYAAVARSGSSQNARLNLLDRRRLCVGLAGGVLLLTDEPRDVRRDLVVRR